MNLDFLLFNPPKHKYNKLDFWGQTIFVPKLRKPSKNTSSLAQFLNCYKNNQCSPQNQTALESTFSFADNKMVIEPEMQQQGTTNSGFSICQQQLEKYIPCLFLNSMVNSKYLILYLHSSGEDIKLCKKMMDLIRNLYQVNVLAVEYSGYSIYRGDINSEVIKEDSRYVYNYVINRLGFRETDIIIMGRSIGTGLALQLATKVAPGALVLISPFASIKSLAKEFVGFFGQFLAKETYNNRQNISKVNCPTFLVHGKKDSLISYQNTVELTGTCKAVNKCAFYPQLMTHSQFDFYSDLADPLRQFLIPLGFDFYEQGQKGPIIPDQLFQWPADFNP